MPVRRSIAAHLALGALAGASLLLAAPASANPQATNPYGTFDCSDGQTIDIYGMDLPRFPGVVGFIDGKGAAARWFEGEEHVTVTVLDGPHAGEVVHADNVYSGPANPGRRSTEPDLSQLATCAVEESFDYDEVLTETTAGYVDLDASYVGATVNFSGSATRTVWVNPLQLSRR